MKLLYASDVHGDIEALQALCDFARKSSIDALVLGGDLAGNPIENVIDELRLQKLKEFEAELLKLRKEVKLRITLKTLALQLEKNKPEYRDAAQEYLILLGVAEAQYHKQYEQILNIVASACKRTIIVPGNHDATALEELVNKNQLFTFLHKKTIDLDGIRLAGYGSADVIPAHIPIDSAFLFDEEEFFQLLSNKHPQLIISHMPPYGVCDVIVKSLVEGIPPGAHVGSIAMRKYLENNKDKTVLCGHVHEGVGAEVLNCNYILNPGNIGMFGNRIGIFYLLEYYSEKAPIAHVFQFSDGVISKQGLLVPWSDHFEFLPSF